MSDVIFMLVRTMNMLDTSYAIKLDTIIGIKYSKTSELYTFTFVGPSGGKEEGEAFFRYISFNYECDTTEKFMRTLKKMRE